ncbi:MAG: hypothetical protein JXA42_16715 [Anaerolineales bacterium]|nr:hypothetical protein [Anaerolineales bacterium]
MIEHVWSVLCKDSVIDQETNNIYLHNIIEQIVIRADPKPNGILVHGLQIVTFTVRSDPQQAEKGELRVSLETPDGKAQGKVDFQIDLETAERSRNIIKFTTIPVSAPGRYYFRVQLRTDPDARWKRVASLPVDISFLPPDIVSTKMPAE